MNGLDIIKTAEGGYEIYIHGNQLVSPERRALRISTDQLAHEIAAEWLNEQKSKQKDAGQPSSSDIKLGDEKQLTRRVFTAVDRVATDRKMFIENILRYFGTELICCRVIQPDDLVLRQAEAWDPILQWLQNEMHAVLMPSQSLQCETCGPEARKRLEVELEALSLEQLTALQDWTACLGSAALAMALLKGRLTCSQAHDLADLEMVYQAEIWGWDPEVEAARAVKDEDIRQTARYLVLSGQGEEMHPHVIERYSIRQTRLIE